MQLYTVSKGQTCNGCFDFKQVGFLLKDFSGSGDNEHGLVLCKSPFPVVSDRSAASLQSSFSESSRMHLEK